MAAPFVPQDALKKLRTVARAKGLRVWVDHQARITGKPFVMLQKDGRTLAEFLCNLHNLHTHVALSFPNLEPPSFWCTDVTEGSLRLHYQSRRPGLAPMVIGLVRGLGVMFSTAVTVALARSRADGHDHDEFVVRFGPAAA